MVMNYTEVEAKVREATNDEAWGPTGKIFHNCVYFSCMIVIIYFTSAGSKYNISCGMVVY